MPCDIRLFRPILPDLLILPLLLSDPNDNDDEPKLLSSKPYKNKKYKNLKDDQNLMIISDNKQSSNVVSKYRNS